VAAKSDRFREHPFIRHVVPRILTAEVQLYTADIASIMQKCPGSMIPKSGYRFSDKIILRRQAGRDDERRPDWAGHGHRSRA
jgi:hypothetical protein